MFSKFYILIDECIVEVELSDYKGPSRVADTYVREARVSTVFLGMEHDGGMFETMIFGGPHHDRMFRYDTYRDAMDSHNEIVSRLRKINWLQWNLNSDNVRKLPLINAKEQNG
jgi:hypothetical protein